MVTRLRFQIVATLSALFCLRVILSPASAGTNIALVPAESVWRYNADGTDLGVSWRSAAYDDAGWPSAPGEIGYGDGGEATRLAVGLAPPITTYFRHSFDVSDPRAFTALLVRLMRDDGAVVYLNGVELLRSNMPAEGIDFATPATEGIEFPVEGNYLLTRVPANALVQGRNVIAVEVHQATGGIADMSFDLELFATMLARPAFVVRGPYLQRLTNSQVTVRWRTDVPTASQVVCGPSPLEPTQISMDPEETTEHEITLTGLSAHTQYYYTIGDGAHDIQGGDNAHHFRTAPIPGTVTPVHMWIIGDCGTGGDGIGRAQAVRDAYLHSSFSRENDVWLMLGDNAYLVGTDAEYQAAVFDTFRSLLRHTALWSTLGNHESYTDGGAPYFNIFSFPTSGEAGGVASGTENYYSFDYANIHFICLDSMLSSRQPGSPMLTWLAADLASTTQEWIIAFWHHPPYSKGSHDSDWEIELVEMRANVLPILEEGGVDLVLSGHSHCYERSYLLDGHYGDSSTLVPSMIKDGGDGREESAGAYGKDPEPHAGAVYVVAGNAGMVSGGALNHPVMFTSLNETGSLVLDVNGAHLTARMLSSQGIVRDHFSISKLPLVTVSAPLAVTGAERPPPGQITLSRTRRLESALPVRLNIGGTAKSDVDYLQIATPFTIPAGALSATIFVQPLADNLFEGPETVTVTPLGDAAYRVQRDNSATVVIKDEEMETWRVAQFGADADNPAIAGDDADPDGDYETNAAEFITGTKPRDRTSHFTAQFSRTADQSISIRFTAFANRSFTVQFKDELTDPRWQKLIDIPAENSDRLMQILDSAPRDRPQRFYRVVAPRQDFGP